MAENKPHRASAIIRPILLVVVLGVVAFLVWRNATRSEGYTGGDITSTGTIESVHLQLAFKVGGRIAEMSVGEGDIVHPGQMVARLEPQDLDVALSTARAALEASRASLGEARANQERAQHDLDRQLELMRSDATTAQQVDDTRAAAGVAAAQVRARMAQVRQAESVLEQARLQREDAEIRATTTGQVSARVHEPGEMVMVGTPVVTLAQVDTVKVRAAVDETRVGAIRPGDSVRVRVYTFDRRWFDGRVIDIRPAGDFATRKDWGAQRRDIRTFTVTAQVPNPDHLLKDGMTAEMTIHVGGPESATKEVRR